MDEGLYSQKTVTYDTKDMEKSVVLQYTFNGGDKTTVLLLRLKDSYGYEWKVQTKRKNVEGDLPTTHGHYASVSMALQLFNRKLQALSYELKEDAHEGWFLPAIDKLLEDAFLNSGNINGCSPQDGEQ